MCLEHGKPRELICVSCKKKCCHTCALFATHIGHDVREQGETMNEITMRMEVLMEMWQQVDQEREMLRDEELCMRHYRILEEKEQCMKDLVSV